MQPADKARFLVKFIYVQRRFLLVAANNPNQDRTFISGCPIHEGVIF
jgi:hypothetical protein